MARWENNELNIEEVGKGWWEELGVLHRKGVITQRVRRVVHPMNDYTRFEMEIHKASNGHGDDIRTINDDVFQSLHLISQDFWLIDDLIALPMSYREGGLYEGFSVDPDIEKYLSAKALLLEYSVPL